MKKMGVSLTIVIALCGVVLAQSGSGIRDEVIAAQNRFDEIVRMCNTKGDMESLVTDDVIWFHSAGSIETGKTDVVKSHSNPSRDPNCAWQEWRVEVKRFNPYGDTAVIFGTLHLRMNANVKPLPVDELDIFRTFVKRNGRWLVAMTAAIEPVPIGSSVKPSAAK